MLGHYGTNSIAVSHTDSGPGRVRIRMPIESRCYKILQNDVDIVKSLHSSNVSTDNSAMGLTRPSYPTVLKNLGIASLRLKVTTYD